MRMIHVSIKTPLLQQALSYDMPDNTDISHFFERCLLGNGAGVKYMNSD